VPTSKVEKVVREVSLTATDLHGGREWLKNCLPCDSFPS
jgi:hypothetical protein